MPTRVENASLKESRGGLQDVVIPVDLFNSAAMVSGKNWKRILDKAAALLEIHRDIKVDAESLYSHEILNEDIFAVCKIGEFSFQKDTDNQEYALRALMQGILDFGSIEGCVTGVKSNDFHKELFEKLERISVQVNLWNRIQLTNLGFAGAGVHMGIDTEAPAYQKRKEPVVVQAAHLARFIEGIERVFGSFEGMNVIQRLEMDVKFVQHTEGKETDILQLQVRGHNNSWTNRGNPQSTETRLVLPPYATQVC